MRPTATASQPPTIAHIFQPSVQLSSRSARLRPRPRLAVRVSAEGSAARNSVRFVGSVFVLLFWGELAGRQRGGDLVGGTTDHRVRAGVRSPDHLSDEVEEEEKHEGTRRKEEQEM